MRVNELVVATGFWMAVAVLVAAATATASEDGREGDHHTDNALRDPGDEPSGEHEPEDHDDDVSHHQKPDDDTRGFRPAIRAVVNGYGLWTPTGEFEASDQVWLRDVELSLGATIDDLARGVVILVAEAETPGEFEYGPEEAFGELFLEPVLGIDLAFRVGLMRTPVGVRNRWHIHELPWFLPPLAISEFLGEEGDTREGAIARWRVRNSSGTGVQIEAGVFNGSNETLFTAADQTGHLSWAGALAVDLVSEQFDLQLGATHMLGVRDNASHSITQFVAAHARLRLFPAATRESLSVTVLVEGMHVPRLDSLSSLFGGYASIEVTVDRRFSFALRGDLTDGVASSPAVDLRAIGVWASWHPHPAVRLRIGFEHRETRENGNTSSVDLVGAQMTITLAAGGDDGGSHPH